MSRMGCSHQWVNQKHQKSPRSPVPQLAPVPILTISGCLRKLRKLNSPTTGALSSYWALDLAFDGASQLSLCRWRAMAPAAPSPMSQTSPQSSHWALCHHTAPVVCVPLTNFPQLSSTGIFLVSPIVHIVYSVLTSPPFFCFDQKSFFHLVPTEFSTVLIPALLSELKNWSIFYHFRQRWKEAIKRIINLPSGSCTRN